MTVEHRAIPDRELCGLVGELSRRIDGHIRERAAAFGLTAPQAIALRELERPMGLSELAGHMCCEPSNATFVVDKLEARGIVERRPNPNDRRAKLLVLTEAGMDLRARVEESLTEDAPMDVLTREEQASLRVLLRRAAGTDSAPV